MMFKQLTRLAVLTACTLVAAHTAAIQERHSFDVSVTIPVLTRTTVPACAVAGVTRMNLRLATTRAMRAYRWRATMR